MTEDRLHELVQAAVSGRGSLPLDPGSIEAAFSRETEREVAALICGESPGRSVVLL